ncbi:iron-sulfur cluster assembly accessory protein [Candidatus Marinimicrobia bacterium]|nr:iron-sulfur cluster assembly accessory protein [Candidatus Neomarinimicrobiota bacterium]
MTETTQNPIMNEDIKVTDKAAARVKVILEGEGKVGFGLRVSVVGGGCSGMTYNMSFDNNQGEFDKVYESKGIKVYCDLKSWLYLKGTEVDFSDDMLSGGFQINNPNAERTCGCGTSFSV